MLHSMRLFCLAAASGSLLTTAAVGQTFVNGDFETGDLTGWDITATPNGWTLSQGVEVWDIDGPGPLDPSNAAKFQVAQLVTGTGQQGIEMAQTLELTMGITYTISFNWAATRDSGGTNTEGGVFTLFVESTDLATAAAGPTSPTTPHYGFIESEFTPTTTGPHRVGIRITRPFTNSSGLPLFQRVDNVTITSGSTPTCYANCDESTQEPILNVADFGCFLSKFAAGDPYANCDESTQEPILNVADFGCFLSKFAAGCR